MLRHPTVPPPAPVDLTTYEQVTALLRAGDVGVLSGAGMSTPSGIPDYRGPDGQRRVQPMLYSEFLADTAGRRRYWARAFAGWERFSAAGPNVAHRAVARWQRAGAVSGIITQNVDGLHQAAGARDVIELHGNLARVVCLDCARAYRRREVHGWLAQANPTFLVDDGQSVVRPDGDVALTQDQVNSFVLVPCPRCGSDRLKPDVVFFGGTVDKHLVTASFALVERSASVLVLGSSLQVMSGYRFVRRAAAQGKPVAVVTRGATRAAKETSVHVDALVEDVLPRLTDDLGA